MKEKRDDLSFSSVNSSLTDEALEKEEKIKSYRRKLHILKANTKKMQKENEELRKEIEGFRKGGNEGIGAGGGICAGAGVSKEGLAAIKEKYEKEAFMKTEGTLREVRGRLKEVEKERDTANASLTSTLSSLNSLDRQCSNLRVDLEEGRREAQRLMNERDAFKGRMKDTESELGELKAEYRHTLSSKESLEAENRLLKHKLVEGEYTGYCFLVRERSPSGHLQEIQLILRKNVFGEPVFEFENRQGDLRVVKASLVSDVESNPRDEFSFWVKYRGAGCGGGKVVEEYSSDNRSALIWNIKNFLTRSREGSVKEKESESSLPEVSIQRNVLSDLRQLFFG